MRIASPIGAAALLALIPIIILYMLRPTHKIIEVPSNYLWASLTEQLTERAKLNKLKRQILLFLDLLTAILIALMLMQFIWGQNQSGQQHIIVLDGSFSMQASDVSPTRLEAAKQKAKKYIDGLPADSLVTLIHLTGEPQIAVKEETNKHQIKRAVDLLAQSQSYWAYKDLEAAINSLKLSEDCHAIYFGDKAVPSVETIRVDQNKDNLSIVKMASEKTGNQQVVLASVHNHSDAEKRVEVSFYDGDLYVETQTKTVPKGETTAIFFTPINPVHSVLRAEIDNQDILSADNVYFYAIDQVSRPSIAYFGEGNAFIDKYLALKDCDVTKRDLNSDTLNGYDLYIFDGILPESLPTDGNIMSLDPQQNLDALDLTSLGYIEFPVFTRDPHSVNQFLQSETFRIGMSQVYDVPNNGAPIFSVPQGALALSYNRGSQKIMVFGFDFRFTDLPLDVQFPVMMNNIYTEMTTSQVTSSESFSNGDNILISPLPQTEKIDITLPDSSKTVLDLDALKFTQTSQYGAYTVDQVGRDDQVIASSSFVINPPAQPEALSFDFAKGDNNPLLMGGQDITEWLAYLLLLLLAVEMYIRLRK